MPLLTFRQVHLQGQKEISRARGRQAANRCRRRRSGSVGRAVRFRGDACMHGQIQQRVSIRRWLAGCWLVWLACGAAHRSLPALCRRGAEARWAALLQGLPPCLSAQSLRKREPSTPTGALSIANSSVSADRQVSDSCERLEGGGAGAGRGQRKQRVGRGELRGGRSHSPCAVFHSARGSRRRRAQPVRLSQLHPCTALRANKP